MRFINEYISISDKAVNERAEIDIYGDITDTKWFDEDVTVSSIKNALNNLEGIKTLELHISSNGGDVFSGNAIFNIIDSFKKKNNVKVETYNDGIAASMASGIVCVGDVIYAAQNSLMMIHKPIIMAVGNANDLRKKVNLLDKAESTLVSNYMRKFNGTEEELRDMMSAETWLSADEAKKYGLVDEIIEPIQMVGSANGIRIGNQMFQNLRADFIKNKYPNIKIEKEEEKLEYRSDLMNYGIDNELFDSLGIETDKILKIVDAVKKNRNEENAENFISKEQAVEIFGNENITPQDVLSYAEKGFNAPDVTELKNKANDYDKIVDIARKNAMKSACRAKGDMYNEERTRKMLNVLDYEEIIEQAKEWDEEAKKSLHAGVRNSVAESNLKNNEVRVNPNDYKI